LADRPGVYAIVPGRVDRRLDLGFYRPETHEPRADEMRFVDTFRANIIDASYNCEASDWLFVLDRTAVGAGIGVCNGFAAHRFIECSFHVIG